MRGEVQWFGSGVQSAVRLGSGMSFNAALLKFPCPHAIYGVSLSCPPLVLSSLEQNKASCESHDCGGTTYVLRHEQTWRLPCVQAWDYTSVNLLEILPEQLTCSGFIWLYTLAGTPWEGQHLRSKHQSKWDSGSRASRRLHWHLDFTHNTPILLSTSLMNRIMKV
jgi:hypothetical protein